MTLPNILGFIGIHLLIVMGIGFYNLGSFIDFPSLQIVVGVTLFSAFITTPLNVVKLMPHIIIGKLKPKTFKEIKPFIDMFESMSRVAIGSGAVGTLIGIILMLGNMADVESIGPNMAVALITLLYAIYLSELLLQPIKRMIISRFDMDSEVDEKYKDFVKEMESDRKDKEARMSIIYLVIFLPLAILFILLFSFTDIFDEDDISIWEKSDVQQLTLTPILINGDSASEFTTQHHLNDPQLVTPCENGRDSLLIRADTTIYEIINSKELLLHFNILHFDNASSEENPYGEIYNFSYPISLRESRTLFYENDSISVKFLVTPVRY